MPCGRSPARQVPTVHADAVPVSHFPTTQRLLRSEVGRLRARESRRVFEPSVHVGVLGGPRTGFVLRARDRPAMDTGLRVDIVTALLDESPAHWCTAWLVRPGSVERHDLDLQWLAAARTAFGIHDRPLDGCYALTRTGWRDVLTDEQREWTRLRL
jgi:hypothetical protein